MNFSLIQQFVSDWFYSRAHGIIVIRKFLKSIPSNANAIFGLTLIIWTIKAVFLDHIPELFPRAAALGVIADGLFSAIIAGYVFYVLFALWPDYKSRQILAPYIFKTAAQIVGDCSAILLEIEHASGQALPFATVQAADIDGAFRAVLLSAPPRMVRQVGNRIVPVTWLEFFFERQERTHKGINDLLLQGRLLEAKTIDLLLKINNCSFFGQVQASLGKNISNSNLGAWADGFARYQSDCRRLAEWHDFDCPPNRPKIL